MIGGRCKTYNLFF